VDRTDVGGVAAALAAVTLLAGIAGLALRRRRWQPWLLVLLDINTGRPGASHEDLRSVEPVDVVLLALAGVAYAGFWPGPGERHEWWMVLAVAQPLLATAVLLVTRLAGRTGLLGGALVLSVLMVVDGEWTTAGWWGIAAAGLLLLGDLTTTGPPRRALVPVVAVGYAALTAWFGVLAVLLLA
jgi:hypothetical protein